MRRPRFCAFFLVVVVVVGCTPAPTSPPAAGASHPGGRSSATVVLQSAVEDAVKRAGKPAAALAIDPNTGDVRALFSVAGDRGDPLLVAHVPGSTFKTFAAIAGLESGILEPNTVKECTGSYRFGDKQLRCAKAHGKETTAQAISWSCNSFFYDLGAHMDHERTLEVARRFGFGERTGVELAEEAGHVPDDSRYREVGRDPSSTVPLLDAIGHGEITMTLPQFARAFAVIANGDKLLHLSLVHGEVERTVSVRPQDLALVRSALVDVVERDDGTAHSVAIPGFPYAGKTGSAEAPPENGVDADDTWFVGYAPPDHAEILVAARVERADSERDAKWVVKQVLQAWSGRSPGVHDASPRRL